MFIASRRVHVEDDEPQDQQRWRHGRRSVVRCLGTPWCSCPDCEPNEDEEEIDDEQDE